VLCLGSGAAQSIFEGMLPHRAKCWNKMVRLTLCSRSQRLIVPGSFGTLMRYATKSWFLIHSLPLFHLSFFFRRNQAVDVVIFRLQHLWVLHKSRSIGGNHKIDHVSSSKLVSCLLGLYSILRMKRELVCKSMVYFLCE
jgi:hypothetical protein